MGFLKKVFQRKAVERESNRAIIDRLIAQTVKAGDLPEKEAEELATAAEAIGLDLERVDTEITLRREIAHIEAEYAKDDERRDAAQEAQKKVEAYNAETKRLCDAVMADAKKKIEGIEASRKAEGDARSAAWNEISAARDAAFDAHHKRLRFAKQELATLIEPRPGTDRAEVESLQTMKNLPEWATRDMGTAAPESRESNGITERHTEGETIRIA